MKTAYFVRKPRTLYDLRQPHLVEQEQAFEVVAEIVLSAIDYENFSLDMVADRQFIEDNASKTAAGSIMKCIFAHGRGKHEGILVVADAPENPAFVSYAAYIAE